MVPNSKNNGPSPEPWDQKCKFSAQVLRVAASRVGPLSLSLREGAHYFQAWAHLLWGGW